MDIVVWLRNLGLGKYEAAFRENEVDETVLPDLTAEDLKELGVAAFGHRRKLVAAIGRCVPIGAAGLPRPTSRRRTPTAHWGLNKHVRWHSHLRRCENLVPRLEVAPRVYGRVLNRAARFAAVGSDAARLMLRRSLDFVVGHVSFQFSSSIPHFSLLRFMRVTSGVQLA